MGRRYPEALGRDDTGRLAATDTTTAHTVDQLRDIIMPYLKRPGMKWTRVFGSYAHGEATGLSHIDVIVERGDARPLATFV